MRTLALSGLAAACAEVSITPTKWETTASTWGVAAIAVAEVVSKTIPIARLILFTIFEVNFKTKAVIISLICQAVYLKILKKDGVLDASLTEHR